jgi:hypothetical protein
VIDPILAALGEVTFQLAERDPFTAVRAVARALRRQTPNAQQAAVALLVRTLAADRPATAGEIVAYLQQTLPAEH